MNIYSIIFIVVSFIIYALLSKYFVFLIYDKALFREELKNKEFTEDKLAIKRYFNWQFMLFFAICFSYLTLKESRIFFQYAMPIAVLLTFVKFYLQLKNEKQQ